MADKFPVVPKFEADKFSALESEKTLVKIQRNSVQLRVLYRFFNGLLGRLNRVQADIPTIATDSINLIYNPHFVNQLSDKNLTFILCHEALHAALGHCNPWRIGSRTKKVRDSEGNEHSLFNIAADYCVNAIIQEALSFGAPGYSGSQLSEKIEMPSYGLYNKKYVGWTVEQIYADLVKESENWKDKDGKKSKGSGGMPTIPDGKRPVDHHLSKEELEKAFDGDEGTAEANNRAWQATSDGLYTTEKQAGTTPAYLDNLKEMINGPQLVPWEQLIKLELGKHYSPHESWERLDRRYLNYGLGLPGVISEHAVFAVGVDTSGSMLSYLPRIYGELNHAFAASPSYTLHLFEADSEIEDHKVYETGQDFSSEDPPKGKGGGGTSFAPIVNFVDKMEDPPKVLIYITDGYGEFPKPPQNIEEVIWVVPMAERPSNEFPFGKVIRVDINEAFK